MEYTAEEKGLLWLCACTDTDYRRRVSLTRAYDPACFLERFPSDEEFAAPAARKRAVETLIAELDKKGYFAVTYASDDYPERLVHIPEPPLVLYCAGNRALLKRRKFAIVGSRKLQSWAQVLGRTVAEALSEHFVIVTGLAEGGDSAAIAGAIQSGNLICVLPNGLDECYPASHLSLKERVRKAGLLVSEYLPNDRGKAHYFYARNRIIAGLSEGVLVTAAAERSGALITANYAVDYSRDVFAFPYNPGSVQGAGCNNLIKKGAYLACGAEDILSSYGIKPQERREIPLSAQEEKVLAALREGGQLHAAILAERTGLKVFEISAVLSGLELKGLAVKAGGNKYSAI